MCVCVFNGFSQITDDSRDQEIVDVVAIGFGQVRDFGRHGLIGQLAHERQFHIEFTEGKTFGKYAIRQ